MFVAPFIVSLVTILKCRYFTGTFGRTVILIYFLCFKVNGALRLRKLIAVLVKCTSIIVKQCLKAVFGSNNVVIKHILHRFIFINKKTH